MGGPGTPAYMSPSLAVTNRWTAGATSQPRLRAVRDAGRKPPFAGKEGFVKRFRSRPGSLVDQEGGRACSTRSLRTLWRGTQPIDTRPPASCSGADSVLIVDQASAATGDSTTGNACRVGASLLQFSRGGSRVVREIEQASIGVLPFANMSNDPENEYFPTESLRRFSTH